MGHLLKHIYVKDPGKNYAYDITNLVVVDDYIAVEDDTIILLYQFLRSGLYMLLRVCLLPFTRTCFETSQ